MKTTIFLLILLPSFACFAQNTSTPPKKVDLKPIYILKFNSQDILVDSLFYPQLDGKWIDKMTITADTNKIKKYTLEKTSGIIFIFIKDKRRYKKKVQKIIDNRGT